MKPTSFPQQVAVLQKPKSMSDEECKSLPVFFDGKNIISCWKPSWREVISIILHRRVWLWVMGERTQPPVLIEADSPFKD